MKICSLLSSNLVVIKLRVGITPPAESESKNAKVEFHFIEKYIIKTLQRIATHLYFHRSKGRVIIANGPALISAK